MKPRKQGKVVALAKVPHAARQRILPPTPPVATMVSERDLLHLVSIFASYIRRTRQETTYAA